MYYQDKPGIYVYYYDTVYSSAYDISGTRKIVSKHYETMDDFLRRHNEEKIKEHFGFTPEDKICRATTEVEYRKVRGYRYVRRRTYCNKINCKEHDDAFHKAEVVYDHNGNFYSPDRLVGLRREWLQNYKPIPWYSRYRHGRKPKAWGWYRSIHTFQERKWAHAWDCEEDAPKIRAKRQGKNLPDGWDDTCRHNDKCWKTQSKRKYQWKERKK
jgi:hypothetical protein